MAAYTELTAQGTPTRTASVLTGISRATASRRLQRPGPPAPREMMPANRLSCAERARVLAVLTSDEFVDSTPLQIFAELLDRGIYLCSVSMMYRILRENTLVTERRRQARHPARKVPELVATGPGQVYSWDITKLPGPAKGVYYDAYVMIDIWLFRVECGRADRPGVLVIDVEVPDDERTSTPAHFKDLDYAPSYVPLLCRSGSLQPV